MYVWWGRENRKAHLSANTDAMLLWLLSLLRGVRLLLLLCMRLLLRLRLSQDYFAYTYLMLH